MKNAVARACAWVSLALLTYAPLAGAQSMEIFTGGARFADVPGNQVPLQPQAIAAAPNGVVYVSDINGRLFRVNVALGTATALPANNNELNFNLGSPNAIALDPAGDLYAASFGALYRLDVDTGTTTNVGSMGTASQMIFAPDGTLYYLEGYESRIWARLPNGSNLIVAGSSTSGFDGDGGPATAALLDHPNGFALAANGDLYIADTNNQRIRKVSAATGIISTVAGTGTYGFNGDGLPALQTNVSQPYTVTFDATGSLIFAGSDYRIRRIDAVSGLVSTIAGSGQRGFAGDGGPALSAQISWPRYLTYDATGALFFGDYKDGNPQSHNVRKIDGSTGIVSRVLGNDVTWFCGEAWPIRAACLANPRGLDVDPAGNLLIADSVNSRVRKASASTGLITTVANTSSNSVMHVEHDANGNIYFATWGGYYVYRIDAATGVQSIFAGNGGFSSYGDGGLATAAGISAVLDVAVDAAGNVYLADANAGRIRKVDIATRIITTYASGFNNPGEIEFDPAGNLVVSEGLTCRLRRIDKMTGVVTTIAGTGTCAASLSGDGGPATSARLIQYQPFAFDPAGNIYLALSYDGAQIRRIDAATGIIRTVPAPPGGFKTRDGSAYSDPKYLEFDAQGRLYITDTYKNLIYRITGLLDSTPPVIEPVVAGTAGQAGWYRSNVNVGWVVSDPESGIRSQTGCTASSVTADTDGVTFTCSATSVGGTSTQSVTIKRDTVAPALTFGAISPAPDASGWNSGDVTVPFTASDARSGVYSTSDGNPLTITGTGPGRSAQITVTDLAGNTATFTSPAVNIDRSAPEIESAISGTAGNAGWYTSDVQVTWTVNESGSPAIVTGCETGTVNTDTTGVTFTCTATSAGGAASKSVTIKRDATPPALTFGVASPDADANGWRAAPVSVPYTANDATSGVATTSSPSPLMLTTPGAAVTGQVIVTDAAGNSATFTTDPYQIDASPPTVTSFVYGTTGTNGWYRTDARVTFSVSDAESSAVTTDGCGETTVSTDTAGITFTCTATSVGGTTTRSVTVKRDATPPALAWGAANPAPNAAGWNTTDVTFPFTTDDAMSGVGGSSHPSPAVVPFDGPGVSTSITVWDNAGNSTTVSTPPVNIDRFAPIVNYFVSGTPGNNGWYTGDVQITWQVVKAPESILAQTGCVNTTVTTDTTGTTFGCSVTSGAGTTSQSVTIKRDATPPTLQWGAFSPNPNTNGWNKTNVTVPFTRADATSGVASTSATSPLTLSTEGAGITGQVTVTDDAGNSQTFTTDPRNIDRTPPVVSLTSPANGASYGFYQDVVADYSCTDVSLLSCTAPSASGDFVNTRTAGARTFKVTAKDQVSYTTSVTNSFNVSSTFNFEGFLPNAAPSPTPNLVAKGSLVPIRWRLPDGNGGFVTNTASFASATVQSYTCSGAAVPLNDPASGAAGISFDPSTNVFTYQWQTGSSWSGCRKLVIKLKDGGLHELIFKFQ